MYPLEKYTHRVGSGKTVMEADGERQTEEASAREAPHLSEM